ncbi:hypothetical protein B0H14DRAFT_3885369 [Mycena olivaceomarginata]|nr:hypothetical protein B0H14DRAFT_3885369 [Mycena olivaceomarginata]
MESPRICFQFIPGDEPLSNDISAFPDPDDEYFGPMASYSPAAEAPLESYSASDFAMDCSMDFTVDSDILLGDMPVDLPAAERSAPSLGTVDLSLESVADIFADLYASCGSCDPIDLPEPVYEWLRAPCDDSQDVEDDCCDSLPVLPLYMSIAAASDPSLPPPPNSDGVPQGYWYLLRLGCKEVKIGEVWSARYSVRAARTRSRAVDAYKRHMDTKKRSTHVTPARTKFLAAFEQLPDVVRKREECDYGNTKAVKAFNKDLIDLFDKFIASPRKA